MLPRHLLKKIRAIEIRTRRIVNDVMAGQYHSAFKGLGMEFEEVREYTPGDDVRSIDWNVTARMQHPFIKKYREERELTVFLVVDMSASLRFGSGPQSKRDLAAEIAAVLALAAIRNNDRVALILHSQEVEHYIPPGKGPRHVLRVVRDILTFEARQTGTRLDVPLTFLNRVSARKSVVFLIGDFRVDAASLEACAITSRRHDLVAIRLHDPRERGWSAAGLVEWIDPESGERHLADTSSRKVQKAVEAWNRAHEEALERHLSRHQVDLLAIETGEAYERRLGLFFRQRVHRRERR